MPQGTADHSPRSSLDFNAVEGAEAGGVALDDLIHADAVLLCLQHDDVDQLAVGPQVHGGLVALVLGEVERVAQVDRGDAESVRAGWGAKLLYRCSSLLVNLLNNILLSLDNSS